MKITIFKKSLHQKASNPKFVWAKDTKFMKQKLIELTGKQTIQNYVWRLEHTSLNKW